ncbi:hypothetical protein JZ751_023781 [Albula glossodonta]|uniref:Uncharacterized protein n=1 Tax=Albula glossodonta TaxID=121402 RepID=A0A8T2NP93_9TELE|nr:hypothetical protein JZ751_023781 [Albula glossodonta]
MLFIYLSSIMRRSRAPSQQCGNVAKRPRFIPPGATASSPDSSFAPVAAQPHQNVECRALNKVLKSLPGQKSEAPVLSKALARILNAGPQGESKQNCAVLKKLSSALSSEDSASEDGPGTGDAEDEEVS